MTRSSLVTLAFLLTVWLSQQNLVGFISIVFDYLLADNLVLSSDQALLTYDKRDGSNSSDSEDA
jgi:hypothetical protein